MLDIVVYYQGFIAGGDTGSRRSKKGIRNADANTGSRASSKSGSTRAFGRIRALSVFISLYSTRALLCRLCRTWS